MSKRIVLLIFVFLLPALSSVASAISWTGGGGSDHLWSEADNWSDGAPNSVDDVLLNKDYTADNNYVLIDSTVTAECESLEIASNAVEVKMYMTGGTLDVNTYFRMNNGNDGRFSLFEMTGGTVTIGGTLKVPHNKYDNPATINLYGGIIDAGALVMQYLHGKIDIQAGVLILDGDVTDAIDTLVDKGYITAFDGLRAVSVDYDTTNPGKTTVMAAGDLDDAYGPDPVTEEVGAALSPTLSWVAGDNAAVTNGHNIYFGTDKDAVTNAACAVPGNVGGPDLDDIYNIANQWLTDPGSSPVSADLNGDHIVNLFDFTVLSGCWKDSSVQFQSNQTAMTFSPGPLPADTTYYWRIDEVDGQTISPGDVWNFTTGHTLSTDYYVAVDGDDNNAGTEGAPWATIQKARDHIRGAHTLATGGVTVWIGGGTYYITETVVFDERDSGTSTEPIVYKAAPDEKPVFCGGREITGWALDSGNIYKVYIDDVNDGNWTFDQLFHDGSRTRPARIPNSGYRTPSATYGNKTKQFKFTSGNIPKGYDYSQAQCVVRGKADFWDIRPIESINWSSRVVTLKGSVYSDIVSPDWRYFIIGVKDALNGNNDFFLDKETGYLYYYTTDTIDDIEIIAPAVDNVFEFKGADVTDPVRHIKLDGLKIWCSKFTDNFDDGKKYNDDSYPIGNRPGLPNRKGLIRLENASHITIENCHLTYAGFNGIAMDFGAQYNTVYNNRIDLCGFYGILMTGRDPGQGVKSDPNEQWYGNHHNTIANNHILKCGKIVYHAGGIFNWQSGENRITHNLIHNMPRAGICFKSRMNQGHYGRVTTTWETRWAYLTNRDNYVGHNHVHTTCTKTSDTGGIVMTSAGRDNVIDYNRVHKNDPPSYFSDISKGIHLDNAQAYTTISNNIVYDIRGAVKVAAIIRPSYNVLTNNIMTISSGTGTDWGVVGFKPNYFLAAPRTMIAHWTSTNNILHNQRTGGAAYAFGNVLNEEDVMDESENNIFYWNGTHKMKNISGSDTFANWKTLFGNKFDQNSVAGNAMFVAKAKQNYNLKPDSPAWALGFQEIDQSDMGLDPNYPVSHSPWPYYGQDKGTDADLLTWTSNPDANSFDVYLATGSVSGNDHNSASFMGNVQESQYAPVYLADDTKYHWRIDDLNNGNVINYGDDWNFITIAETNNPR